MSESPKSDQQPIITKRTGRVGWITLNRPKALNALNSQLMYAVVAAAEEFDADPAIGAIVITGSEKAFAAGADILEMQPKGFTDVFTEDLFADWDRLRRVRKPIIAGVAGYALGGGCELAMTCDLIIAADNAKFGQPEINLGVIPGMGGSQRLTRAIGKAKAMDLILTGRMMGAEEAERSGLVARVVPPGDLLQTVGEIAATIAEKSLPSVLMAKEVVNRAFETTLAEGLTFERRNFQALFATDDQSEGMTAFAQKREPAFRHR